MWLFSNKAKDNSKKSNEDTFVKEVSKLQLQLAVDPLMPYEKGRLNLNLTIINHTPEELSPALLILMARKQAWHIHDPRMGRWNLEFNLRDFNKKVQPGQSQTYRLSVRMMSTIKPGDGIWMSFEYKGYDKQLLTNRVRVPDTELAA